MCSPISLPTEMPSLIINMRKQDVDNSKELKDVITKTVPEPGGRPHQRSSSPRLMLPPDRHCCQTTRASPCRRILRRRASYEARGGTKMESASRWSGWRSHRCRRDGRRGRDRRLPRTLGRKERGAWKRLLYCAFRQTRRGWGRGSRGSGGIITAY